MTLATSEQSAFADVKYLGVAAKAVSPLLKSQEFGVHAGFIYKIDEDDPRVAHLAWHEDQRDNQIDATYLWSPMPFLEEPNCHVVASWLHVRRSKPDLIPYGFRVDGRVYDAESDAFIPPPPGQGLTCATFIVAVLRHLGFSLLVGASWPNDRQDDREWQEAVVAALKEQGASEQHVKALAEDVGARRYRPDEVVGAATLAEWPVAFPDAAKAAQEVIAAIAASRKADV